jgi:hypothetical protein
MNYCISVLMIFDYVGVYIMSNGKLSLEKSDRSKERYACRIQMS